MKHNKIFSSEVVHKGKTLDRVLDGGNNSNSSSSNCYLFNFDYDHPPITVGESVFDLLNNEVFDRDIPIQFVYSDYGGLYHNGLFDIIYPYNPETKEIKCESIFKFRHYRLDSAFLDYSGLTFRCNLTATFLNPDSYPDLCYKSYSVDKVHVDLDKKTITYTDTIEEEGRTATASAIFSFLVPKSVDSMGNPEFGSPEAIEVINSGTQLKLYLHSTSGDDYILINIATQN